MQTLRFNLKKKKKQTFVSLYPLIAWPRTKNMVAMEGCEKTAVCYVRLYSMK